MSHDEIKDSPANRTRQKDLGRRALTPLAERMVNRNKGSCDDSSQERNKPSSRSPRNSQKKPRSYSNSPKGKKKNQPGQRNKLYPDLTGIDADDADNSEEESSDIDDSALQDTSGYEDVSRDSNDGYSPESRRAAGRGFDDSSSPAQPPRRDLRDNKVKEETDVHSSESNVPRLLLLIAILAIFGGIIWHFQRATPVKESRATLSVDYYELFKPRLDMIKSHYPSQTSRFWKIIGSALKRLLNEKGETYPAVLLFGISADDSQVGTCISREIIKSLNSFYNSSETGFINSADLDSMSAGKMKLDLDKRMIRILDVAKGVAVDHVEILPGQTALLFHGYCDGDNAPYKSSVILLAVHSDKVKSNDNKGVEDILNELWEKDLGVDEMPALRSRIANNIAIVSPEKSVSC